VSYQIRVLGPGDEALFENVAPEVFDYPVDRAAVAAFLADPRHHIAVAVADGAVVASATGVHYFHPDKPVPELWVNEVAVSPDHRERGLAKAVLAALFDAGRALGCREAWVLTERTNEPAIRLYRSKGGREPADEAVMFSFRLDA
jgi:ribosomal protein S18 acetylase RimI-like enzyme